MGYPGALRVEGAMICKYPLGKKVASSAPACTGDASVQFHARLPSAVRDFLEGRQVHPGGGLPASLPAPCPNLSSAIPAIAAGPAAGSAARPGTSKSVLVEDCAPQPAKRTCKSAVRLVSRTKPPEAHMVLHGNDRRWAELRAFVESGSGVALLVGPVGGGKSTGVRIMAHSLRMQVVDFHGADAAVSLQDIDDAASRQSFGGRSLALLEDVDCWSDLNLTTLRQLCGGNLPPVVCTAASAFAPSLRGLRERMRTFQLQKLPLAATCAIVRWHLPTVSDATIRMRADEARGDLRQVLFGVRGIGSRTDARFDVFACARGVLRRTATQSASMQGVERLAGPALLGVLFENYTDAATSAEALAAAAETFSAADVMRLRPHFPTVSESECVLSMLDGVGKKGGNCALRFSMLPRDPGVRLTDYDVPTQLGGSWRLCER